MASSDNPSLDGLEEKWDATWEREGTYRFDRSKGSHEIYAIDTPPPTVSGALHLGSAFGYVQTDALARFHRMRGEEVFYPMGWDDNGLPTERRVQNYYGVRCDPTMPQEPLAIEPEPNAKEERPVSRSNFIELCRRLTIEDEKAFEHTWRELGLSVDWNLTYSTIGHRARRVSQLMFLRRCSHGSQMLSTKPPPAFRPTNTTRR